MQRRRFKHHNHRENSMTPTLDTLRDSLARDYKIAPELLVPESLLEELGVDSLCVAELLFNIEDELSITVPPEPVTLTTLGDVVAYIDGLIQAQSIADTPSKDAVSVPA